MTDRFVVLRRGGDETMLMTGVHVPRWESIGSAMFGSLAEAREFASHIRDATVCRVIPVDDSQHDSS